jgi:hypothetical protein
MPIKGVVKFATIAGPAIANTCAVVTFDGEVEGVASIRYNPTIMP